MLEEGQIGSDYLVNLKVKANLNRAEKSDELRDTVDYVLLQKIVKEEMPFVIYVKIKTRTNLY